MPQLGISLVLASASPQRREIMERLGLDFEVRPAQIDELRDGDPESVARGNSLRKARAAAEQKQGDELIIGADTVVAIDRQIFGKPASEADARATIMTLSGREHSVTGGLSVISGDFECVQCCVTHVTFRELDRKLIDWYIGTGEWRERAGSYAIQGRGAALVEKIDGDYLNVVGLPLALLLETVPGLLLGSGLAFCSRAKCKT